MRTDAVDLDMAGYGVRVVCEDASAALRLRSALRDHLIDQAAPLGFTLKAPIGRTKFYLLLDRSGLVLARVRSLDGAIAALASHLAGFLPSPLGTTRMRARALVGDDSRAVLAGSPLLIDPPIVERRIERAGFRLVDRLVVDLTPDAKLSMVAMPWPELAAPSPTVGHTGGPLRDLTISAVLVPRIAEVEPSRANLVAFFSAAMSSIATPVERLDLAENLASAAVATVSLDDRAGVYSALQLMTPADN